MVKYTDKKWLIMQPVTGGRWDAPNPNMGWTMDCNVNMGRLLQCGASHVCNPDIDMTADIYILLSAHIYFYEQELDFMRRVKANGAKVVLGISTDHKFLTGNDLIDSNGTIYTALCKEADVIMPGIPTNMKFFGRYQHKVVDVSGLFLERLNFSLPYEQRDIDILLTGSLDKNEITLAWAIEIMMMLKEKYPDKKISYPTLRHEVLQHKYPEIDFIDARTLIPDLGLVPLLQRAKIYIHPDPRPGPGRAILESFYCRTPYVSSDMFYHSKYYPDFTYNYMNMEHIIDRYEKISNANREEIIKKSETLAEEDYFENAIARIVAKLYPNE
jgi:hypothetical protein